jgi:hypothetical protein
VASLMFPDNTVLINFAIINRMDLLEKLANGNGQWCATVARECAESAGYPGLAALSAVEDIFGEPLEPAVEPGRLVMLPLFCFLVSPAMRNWPSASCYAVMELASRLCVQGAAGARKVLSTVSSGRLPG